MNKKIRVLVVEQNATFCFLTAEELKLRDFEIVGTVCNGQSALQIILDEQPDIVLLEIIIPGIDGLAVLRSVASSNLLKKPAFIMTTFMSTGYYLRESAKWGASYLLSKPFDFDVLSLRIRKLFASQQYINLDV